MSDSPSPARWSETQAQTIGENVLTFRDKLRYSAAELSKETAKYGQQIPRSTIQKIETGGKKSVLLHEAMILAQAIGIPLGYLLYSPYEPGKLFSTPYAKVPVPAYWAADALSPVTPQPEEWSNPIVWAVEQVRTRAHQMSGVLTNARSLGRLDSWIRLAKSQNKPKAVKRLEELQESIEGYSDSLWQILQNREPQIEAAGIVLWPLEEHIIPRSYYHGNDPESYDPWSVEDVARTLLNERNQDA